LLLAEQETSSQYKVTRARPNRIGQPSIRLPSTSSGPEHADGLTTEGLRVERLVAGCGCQKQAASGRRPGQSLTDSDNNSKLENWNFGFIFCFNDVNMLKGIRALPQLE